MGVNPGLVTSEFQGIFRQTTIHSHIPTNRNTYRVVIDAYVYVFGMCMRRKWRETTQGRGNHNMNPEPHSCETDLLTTRYCAHSINLQTETYQGHDFLPSVFFFLFVPTYNSHGLLPDRTQTNCLFNSLPHAWLCWSVCPCVYSVLFVWLCGATRRWLLAQNERASLVFWANKFCSESFIVTLAR